MRYSLLAWVPVVGVCVLGLTGCGTVFNHPYQMVHVKTPGVMGADCRMLSPEHRYAVVTPATIQIERSQETLKVICTKVNYKTAIIDVEPRMGISLGVMDIGNGYPDTISIDMELDEAALAENSKVELPEPLKKRERAMPEEAPTVPADTSFTKSLKK